MKIVLICGVWDGPRYDHIWEEFKSALQREFLDAEISIERRYYSPYNRDEIRSFVERLVAKYDLGGEIMFVGHSMGGGVAVSVASLMQRSSVRAIVTIFSPHGTYGSMFSHIMGAHPITAPLITFGAFPDRLVPWGSRHEKSVRHETFFTDHMFGLGWRAKDISRVIREEFNKLKPG